MQKKINGVSGINRSLGANEMNEINSIQLNNTEFKYLDQFSISAATKF